MNPDLHRPVPSTRSGVRVGHTAVLTPDLDRFTRFYEDVIGLRLVAVERPPRTTFRRLGAFADGTGTAMAVLAFEIPGYTSGLADDLIGRRGRLDHLAFHAGTDEEFDAIASRLVDAGASSGEVTCLGPVRSVLFVDPDGAHHNLQIESREYEPDSTLEIVDSGVFDTIFDHRTDH